MRPQFIIAGVFALVANASAMEASDAKLRPRADIDLSPMNNLMTYDQCRDSCVSGFERSGGVPRNFEVICYDKCLHLLKEQAKFATANYQAALKFPGPRMNTQKRQELGRRYLGMLFRTVKAKWVKVIEC
ncbi:hypothetical protein MCOR27_005048 [Pyricularia oryzae]|nr:hypothetical protein MCOR01_005604 [Pyricularia oryzae]KAH9434810.1 hypothetical protein MCOR02_003773 [Pyricularia oryzae]KAI6279584.1 hypothetical protein MCOR27_005048 [Pyricularia oryzae]KAI6461289.1 hypothetical protein MCOR15_005072 [Pyricularia oryzae]KAI6575342.1 hypothetical protein MCOR04_007026 [Pyricularia oryzae]